MFEVKGVGVVIFEGPQDLIAHPFDLGLGELDHVVRHVVEQGQREFGETRLLTPPQLVQELGQFQDAA